MKKILFVLISIVFCILYSGCASQAFTLNSDPEGADIYITNDKGETALVGKTPAMVSSKYIPKGDYIISISKTGYEKKTVLEGNSSLKLKKMNLGTRSLKKIGAEGN